MTRGQARTLLRSRIQETEAAAWSDAVLDGHINSAVRDGQKAVLGIDPEAFVAISLTDIQKDKSRIVLPAGLIRIFLVQHRGSTTEEYKTLLPMGARDTAGRTASKIRYAILGDWLILTPTPGTGVSDGIKLWWCPTATASDDGEVLPLPIPLHDAVVTRARVLTLKDTDEDTTADQAEWLREVRDISTWYVRRNDMPAQLAVAGIADKP